MSHRQQAKRAHQFPDAGKMVQQDDFEARAIWHLGIGYADDALMYDDEYWDGVYAAEDRTCLYCDGVGGDPWCDYIMECPQCLGEGVRL